ncbi:MAG: hypothetical protein F4Y86_02015 [Gammaproteobacteria bacterium]|nr:hypothetical protein [Gammaproteobacteria bacterium]
MDAAQLVTEVRRLRNRHQVRRDSGSQFNIFATLRSSSDEVNLHSRFLHALLDRREPDGQRKNLEDFLTTVAKVEGFPTYRASVGREIDNIDLLIQSHDQKQALVIENKIWAGDQEQQLWRYWKKLRRRGYPCGGIHLLYLTPFGDPPSAQSIGNLQCSRVSYRDHLPRWLARCGHRAWREPALRESIVQYLDLILNLTNSHPYMNDLKNLCLDDENLILAQDLTRAIVEAKTDLIVPFWSTMDQQIRVETKDPLERDPRYAHLTEHVAVQRYIERAHGSDTGLYYWIAKHAWLAVTGGWDGLWFGISCHKNIAPELYEKLHDAASDVEGGSHAPWAPWYCYPDGSPDFRNLNPNSLSLLKSEEGRLQLAQTISVPIAKVWREINCAGLIEARPG